MTDDMERIREDLRLRARELAEMLFPGGRHEAGGRYWPANHVRGDRRPGSMVIDTAGPTAGRWVDFADPESAKGDALALIAYAHAGSTDRASIARAIAWARKWLGLSDAKTSGAIRSQARGAFGRPVGLAGGAGAAPPDDEALKAEREAKARKALGWFLHAERDIAGTPVERYLASRGLALDALGFHPGALRYHPSLTYRGPDAPEPLKFPGMIAAMTDAAGRVRAVHRTFLRADGAGKAPVARAKKMWGDVRGCSIRLSKGENGCTPEEAARQGLWGETLALGEGIEDMLNWSLLYPEHRTAACGALSMIGAAPVYPSVERVILVRDNDENAKTRAAFDAQAAKLVAAHPGVEMAIAEPLGAKDINDLWRECL